MFDLYPKQIKDFNLEVARGNVPGMYSINKYGRTNNADAGVATDVWLGSDFGFNPYIAPTAARIHNILSTSVNDTAAGSGARTIRIYGLQDWDSAETTEDITMNGTTVVVTANAYVMIHRVKVLTWGTIINDGNITVSAQVDATFTLGIVAGDGQSQSTVYGVPSTQKFYMNAFYASLNSAVIGADVEVDIILMVNPAPDVETTQFIMKHCIKLQSSGTSAYPPRFDPPKIIPGPCIVKIEATASVDNTDVSAGFNGIVVDK